MSKRGSKSTKTEISYEIGDTVLGKVRGYPPWPGRVIDPESANQTVSRERPVNKKSLFYCVQFYPAGDHAWLPSKDISKLKPSEIESYISDPAKRNGELLQGYKIARDPMEWLRSQAEATAATAEDDGDDEEDNEAEADGDEEDELADESGDKSSGKKRKTPSASTAKKRKRESEPGTKASKASTKPKGPGKGGRKSKAAIESEDDEAANKEEASPPAPKKAKVAGGSGKDETAEDAELLKDPEANKVREWRHRLQKVFLSSKNAAPKEEDMPDMNNLFTQIERYEKINIQYLSFSKIGKVMRHITALTDEKVPLDAKYKFRERAKVLVEQWQHIINAGRSDGGSSLNANPNANSGTSTKNHRPNANSNPNSNRGNDSQSPNPSSNPNGLGHEHGQGNANENVNGIADAINVSIAGGAMDTGLNGHGHVNGNTLNPAASSASIDTQAGDIGDVSMLSEMGAQ